MHERPIDKVKEIYAKSEYSFEDMVGWHLSNGFVVSVPDMFAAGYFYRENEKTVLYVTALWGEMKHLLKYDNFVIDFIEFQRDFSGISKRYDFKRFVERI